MRFQTLKGTAFVLFTGVILGFLIQRNEIKNRTMRNYLIQSESEVLLLMNNTEESFVLVDTQLRIVSFNKQFEETYRRLLKKKVNKGDCIIDYAWKNRKNIAKDIYERVLAGATVTDELTVPDENEEPLYFASKYKPATDYSGNVIGVFVSLIDITEKKKSQLLVAGNEKRFKALIENIGDMISLTDVEGKITYVSPAFEKITGFSLEELKGKKGLSIMHPENIEESKRALSVLLDNPGTLIPRTNRFINKDGNYRWVEGVSINLLHDENVQAIVANYRDVTERKKTEELLLQTEARYRALIENNYDGIVLRDADFKIIYSSKSAERILGWTNEDKLGKNFVDKTHPDDIENLNKHHARVMKTPGVPLNMTFRTLHKNGQYVWVERVMTNLLHDKNVNAIVANFRDVTEQRSMQQQIIDNEKRFRALVENSSDSVIIMKADGSPSYISPSFTNVLGYSEEEAWHMDLFSLAHPNDMNVLTENMERSLNNPGKLIKGGVARILHKDGNYRWLEAHLTNMIHDPAIGGIVDNFRDVTDSVLANQQKEFEKRSKEALINTTDDVIWSVDKKFRLLAGNKAFIESLRLSTGKELQPGDDLNLKEYFPEKYLAEWEKLYKQALTGQSVKKEMYIEETANQEPHWTEISLHPIIDGEEIIGIAGYGRNITENKLLEEKLKSSEAQFRGAFENSAIGIALLSPKGRWIEVNDSLCSILGYSKDELLNLMFHDVTHPDDLKTDLAIMRDLAEGKQSAYHAEKRYYHKNGSIVWVLLAVSTIKTSDGELSHYIAQIEDITLRKITEEKLKQNTHELLLVKKDLEYNASRLKQAQEVAHIGNWEVNFSTNTSRWSEEVYRIYGLDPKQETLNFEKWMTFIHPADEERCVKEIEKAREELTGFSLSHRIVLRDGAIRYIDSESRFEFTPEGAPKGLYGIVRDVTETKLAEKKLLQSHQLLQKLTEKVPIAVYKFRIDRFGRMTFPFLSKGIEQLMPEVSIEEMKGDASGVFQSVIPEDLPGLIESIEYSKNHLTDWDQEFRAVNANGKLIWIKASSRPEKQDNGSVVWHGYLQDITETKSTEHEIRIAKERYDIVAKATNDALYDWDLKSGEVIRTGEGLQTLFGYTKEEAKEPDFWLKRVHPEDLEVCYNTLQSLLADTSMSICNQEYRFKKADGTYAYVFDKGFIIRNEKGEAIRMLGATQDISRQKISEIQIKKTNERYNLVSKATRDAIWDYDFSTDRTYIAGSGYKELFGYDVINTYADYLFWESRIHPEDKQRILEELKGFIENVSLSQYAYEYRFLKTDGSYAYVHDRLFIIRDNGIPVRLIGAINDITRQKEEEQRLRLLESVITNTNDAIMITDANPLEDPGPRIIYVNEAFTKMSGYSKEEMIGHTPKFFQGQKTDKSELDRLIKALRKNEACSLELINYRKNGTAYWVSIDITPVADAQGTITHLIAIQKDITSRKVQQQEKEKLIFELIQNNKDLRQFSYITSHNLRGPVANLLGLTNLIDNYQIQDPVLKQILDGIKKATNMFDETIKDLSTVLNVKDRGSIPREEINLETVFDKVLTQCKTLIKESEAHILVDFSQAPSINFNKAYIESILMNLLTNAIKYRSRSKALKIEITSRDEEDAVDLFFRDNGQGIDIELHKEKLFRLYQRFHDNAEGKGLGLFLVKSQIEALNGSIEIESTLGEGTLFKLRFKKQLPLDMIA